MAVRPIDGNVLIEWFRPYLHTGEAIPADVVIEDIRSMPTLTPPNEPLTLDELLKMDGEPVYVVPENEYSELGGWCVISADDSDDYSCALVPGIDCWCWMFEAYGEQWLAYRRPPEGEEAGNG